MRAESPFAIEEDEAKKMELDEEEKEEEEEVDEEKLALLQREADEREAEAAAAAASRTRRRRIRLLRDAVEERLEEAADFLRRNLERNDEALPWMPWMRTSTTSTTTAEMILRYRSSFALEEVLLRSGEEGRGEGAGTDRESEGAWVGTGRQRGREIEDRRIAIDQGIKRKGEC